MIPRRVRRLFFLAFIAILLTCMFQAFHLSLSAPELNEPGGNKLRGTFSRPASILPIVMKNFTSKITLASQSDTIPHVGYPVVRRENYIPNFYTMLSAQERDALAGQKIAISYLHHQKCAGMSMRKCMSKIAKTVSPAAPRLIWDGSVVAFFQKRASENYQPNNQLLFYGDAAFGVCDTKKNGELCSYFTVLRDPYDRIVSAYEYCIAVHSLDPICILWKVDTISIEDFALHTGSHLFAQILFNVDICRLNLKDSPELQAVGERDKIDKTKKVHCWYNHKAFLDYHLNATSKQVLLDYVVRNLEKWFMVIGMSDEYGLSLEMLEKAYGIPFAKECKSVSTNYNKERNSDSARNEYRNRLVADKRVREALYYDEKIFEEALRIFNKQKKLLLEETSNDVHVDENGKRNGSYQPQPGR